MKQEVGMNWNFKMYTQRWGRLSSFSLSKSKWRRKREREMEKRERERERERDGEKRERERERKKRKKEEVDINKEDDSEEESDIMWLKQSEYWNSRICTFSSKRDSDKQKSREAKNDREESALNSRKHMRKEASGQERPEKQNRKLWSLGEIDMRKYYLKTETENRREKRRQ